jgi:Holliday junction resolvase
MSGREFRRPRSDRNRIGDEVEIEVAKILNRHGYAVQPTGAIGSVKGAPQFFVPDDSSTFHLSPDLIACRPGRRLVVEAKQRKLYLSKNLYRPTTRVLYIDEQIVLGMADFAEHFDSEALYAFRLEDGRYISASHKDITPHTAHGRKASTSTAKAAFTFEAAMFRPFEEMIVSGVSRPLSLLAGSSRA